MQWYLNIVWYSSWRSGNKPSSSKHWRNLSTVSSSWTSLMSSIETTWLPLFVLLFRLKECLNLHPAVIALFLKEPLLTLLSPSEFSSSHSLFSSLRTGPSSTAPKYCQCSLSKLNRNQYNRNTNQLKIRKLYHAIHKHNEQKPALTGMSKKTKRCRHNL